MAGCAPTRLPRASLVHMSVIEFALLRRIPLMQAEPIPTVRSALVDQVPGRRETEPDHEQHGAQEALSTSLRRCRGDPGFDLVLKLGP